MKQAVRACCLGLAFTWGFHSPVSGADFELGGEEPSQTQVSPQPAATPQQNVVQRWSQNRHSGMVPSLVSLGDIPTAYALLKYELTGDIRFYEGGGVMAKAHVGIWPRFSFGGAVNVRNFVGPGDLTLTRDDATVVARLLLLPEQRALPAISVGWDGPAYAGGEMRGLYAAVSKEVSSALGYFQAHGGVNSAEFEAFVLDEDLRVFAGVSTMIYKLLVFFEADELLHPLGPRLNTGFRVYFEPISLGIEFQDLGATRTASTRISRMLRVSYTGLF